MKIYHGYGQPIEVTDEWNEILIAEDKVIAANNKKESRRHCSMEAYNIDSNLIAAKVNIESDYIAKEICHKIRMAISKMKPKQRCLIEIVYYKDTNPSDIAKAEGSTAVYNRLNTAHRNLKKILK